MKKHFSRRNFLQTAAISASTVMLPAFAIAAEKQKKGNVITLNKNPLKLGMMTYTLGKDEDLVNPILGGHYSSSLAHLANISYRLGGRELKFNGATEKFVNDPEADALLTRKGGYRKPYVVPDKV